jgi:hypothetical protein
MVKIGKHLSKLKGDHIMIHTITRYALSLLGALVLCAATGTSGAFAQVSGGFDETGNYQYNNSPSFKPSPGHDGWSQYQRQEEQMERYRQESLNQERLRERNASTPDTLVPRSSSPSYIYQPDGSMRTCYSGGKYSGGAVYCR